MRFLLISAVLALAVPGAVVVTPAQAQNCVCASCGRSCGSGHASSCPYAPSGGGGGGGGDSESAPRGDITNAPIFVAPAGFIGGLFMGAGWYYNEMAGKYPKTGFLVSYHKFLTVKTDNDRFDSAFSFGSHIGAAPWLAIFAPTWPIRQGVVAVKRAIDRPPRPKPPKPADPRVAVYELIASNYAALGKATDEELAKAGGDVEKAALRRERYLDGFINDSEELRALRDKDGAAAARARAEGQLDAWSKARAEKRKLARGLSDSIREKDAYCKAALDKIDPAAYFADFQAGKTEERLNAVLEDKTLTPGARDSLTRELRWLKGVGQAKLAYDIGGDVKGIVDSYNDAAREGKDAARWIEDRAARERIWRLDLKLLGALPGGGAAAVGEAAVDIGFAVTAGVVLGGQIDAEMAQLEKLATANVFQDAMGDDWDRANIAVEAARKREDAIRRRRGRYTAMQQENQAHAQVLRAK